MDFRQTRSWHRPRPGLLHGIVFELFDAKASCGRFAAAGGTTRSSIRWGAWTCRRLGFGMGDVVLAELLRERGYLQDHASVSAPDFWIAAAEGRRAGLLCPPWRPRCDVRAPRSNTPCGARGLSKQKKASHSAGATYFVDARAGLSSVKHPDSRRVLLKRHRHARCAVGRSSRDRAASRGDRAGQSSTALEHTLTT